jgi:hypothetical protein
MTSQSYTLIDPAGNQAQYTVYGADRRHEYHGQRTTAIVDLTVGADKSRVAEKHV